MRKKIRFNKKIVFLSIAFFLFLIALVFNPITIARYVYNAVRNYYLETQDFYFNCDKMSLNNSLYQIDNWDGVDDFSVTFNMNSIKNNLVVSKSDISYNLSYTCSSNVSCTASKNNGVIDSRTNRDYFTINIHPVVALQEGDSVWLNVTSSSVSPYVQTISGRIQLNVGIPGLSYEIMDEENRPYLNFSLTNTFDFYKVIRAYGNHSVGEEISSSAYRNLSDAEKANYASALITLSFNPNVVLLDLTSEFYQDAISHTEVEIDGYQYVNSITFKVDPISSEMIRFYKKDASMNYTYPYGTNTPIISFTAS